VGLEIASFSNRFSGRDGAWAVRARKAVCAEFLVRHMATEVREDRAGMNREGANSIRFAAPIEFHSKQHIRGFRLAISLPPVIGAMLKLRIVKINSGALVTAGRNGNDARAVGMAECRPEARR
jgi:hypothetical protein